MKKYLIPLILLIVLVATPVLAVQNNQALIRSLQLRIQQLTLQLQKLLALQPISVSVPTSWQTYSDNGVTFKYPDSLAPACADLQKPSVKR
ncbi:MAG: hypothetical protein NTV48_00415 [Candidatus Vogelbacteria bacterium]|nr:hypothetical protein [Candidatus Vogelbacteria bacterium]